MTTGALAKLIDDYKAVFDVGDVELAKRIGVSRQALHLWRTSERRALPDPANLRAFAAAIGVSYRRALDAALADAGYLEDEDDTRDRLNAGDVVDITNIVSGTIGRPLTAKESARLRGACVGEGPFPTLTTIATALSTPGSRGATAP